MSTEFSFEPAAFMYLPATGCYPEGIILAYNYFQDSLDRLRQSNQSPIIPARKKKTFKKRLKRYKGIYH